MTTVEISPHEKSPLLSKESKNDPKNHSFYNRGKQTYTSAALLLDENTQHSLTGVGSFIPPHPKSNPSYVPFTRYARHRSPELRNLNTFRHWWKSSRLLVRLAGMFAYLRVEENWKKVHGVGKNGVVHHIWKKKGVALGFKEMKHIGRGGPMKEFLNDVHPFTRTLRIVVAVWRTLEAWEGRRHEVGVEEALAFIGNRVSRQIARLFTDLLTLYVVFPLLAHFRVADENVVAWAIISLGILRGVLPFCASFQGSRLGRVVTRGFFVNVYDRWRPLQRIGELNLKYVDGFQEDPLLSSTAKEVAMALGKVTTYGGGGDVTKVLKELGWFHVGDGSGGYNHYEKDDLSLHVTPYGPSIVGEMPRYVVLENNALINAMSATTSNLKKLVYQMRMAAVMNSSSEFRVEGFCYSGAFFPPPLWAELKKRYDREMTSYYRACQLLGVSRSSSGNPPSDLLTLKKFIETGRLPPKQKKHEVQFTHIHKLVQNLSQKLKRLPASSRPQCVILYFEGLDCAGKSSTGGLIQSSLSEAGYTPSTVAYNRAPTEEERRRPWMDRFAVPPEGHCLVWDRGPGGDFVYGILKGCDEGTKGERYAAFGQFERECRERGVLFCKMMFVTDRDAIARTLGKRLAHKRIVMDLREWLDASRPHSKSDGEVKDMEDFVRVGLEEIETHIDPTDFVAFNKYTENLTNFVDFAKGTDQVQPPSPKTLEDDHHIENGADDSSNLITTKSTLTKWDNPWLVLNTSRRYPARLALLGAFDKLLKRFTYGSTTAGGRLLGLGSCCDPFESTVLSHKAIPVPPGEGDRKMYVLWRSLRITFFILAMCLLIYMYAYHTWLRD